MYELLQSTANQTPGELAQEVEAAYDMFQGADSRTKVLEAMLGATSPCCFLMVLAGSPLQLMLLHTLACYNTTFGIRDGLQGSVFGFLGEWVASQLPTTLLVPELRGA